MSPHVQSRAVRILASACGAALALALAGCAAGYTDVDGYQAAYVTPPAAVVSYPRYAYGGGYVYDVDGRYYRHYHGRWVTYHRAPPEVVRWHNRRGSAEWQRR